MTFDKIYTVLGHTPATIGSSLGDLPLLSLEDIQNLLQSLAEAKGFAMVRARTRKRVIGGISSVTTADFICAKGGKHIWEAKEGISRLSLSLHWEACRRTQRVF